MPPRFAEDHAASRPVHLIAADGLADWLALQPVPVQAWLQDSGFKAGLGEVRLIPGEAGGVGAAVVGLGSPAHRRRSRFGAIKGLTGLPAGDWHLEGPVDPDIRDEIALGWLLSTYRFDRYKPATTPQAVRLKAPEGADVARLCVLAEAEFLTRDLINTPASDLGPDELQAAFMALAARFGAATQAIVGDDLLTQGFPMVHAVGRASTRAPRILSLRWGSTGPSLTLVGKGVCFDTGGLDLKPASGMALMKKDMGGAATVMGLAQMIMALNLPVRLRVIVPAVENAVAGNAMRPGDILTSRKGLTVEINNTDAEGRLILADALAWAEDESPEMLISMATLTGAARVAVGPDLAPFYTDDDTVAQALADVAGTACDPVWRMPFWPAYETQIEAGIADLDNAPSGGMAGSITAALFLRRFTDCPRYTHFDIYGHTVSDAPARPKGGVGQGARAILGALPRILGI